MSETLLSATRARCSLEGGAFAQRMAEIMALLLRFGGQVEKSDCGAVLRFARREALKPALENLIEAERSCCPTLTFQLEETATEYAVRIGIPPSRPAVADTARAAERCC